MMKKGGKFFEDFTSEGSEVKTKGRGRSAVLNDSRNNKLFHRYYYYGKILHYKYDMVLNLLSNEFDLREFTIASIVGNHLDKIKEIADKKPTRNQLRGMYPYFFWNDKELLPVMQKGREVYNGY